MKTFAVLSSILAFAAAAPQITGALGSATGALGGLGGLLGGSSGSKDSSTGAAPPSSYGTSGSYGSSGTSAPPSSGAGTIIIQAPAGPVNLCAGSTGSAKCCATDVLGVAGLNCVSPPNQPKVSVTTADFRAACAGIGQQAKCCAIPILGQALVCSDPL